MFESPGEQHTGLFGSTAEKIGWVVAVIVVALMGVITFHGHWGKVNKAANAAPPVAAALHVSILDSKTTVGRYSPATITARVGQPVIFTNNSSFDHTVTEKGGFDSGDIGRRASWKFTPRTAGTFHYYCLFHPHMLGVLKVQP